VYINEKLNKIVKTSNRLQKEYERTPTLEEIAEETNTPLESVEKVMQNVNSAVLVDTAADSKGEYIDNIDSPQKLSSTFNHVLSSHLSKNIDLILEHLTPREREIVKLRFGIGTKHDHTLGEIGDKFDVSRERIRQILEVALKKLKNPTVKNTLKEFVDFN
jgi:RNA polymerase primary sigma factor